MRLRCGCGAAILLDWAASVRHRRRIGLEVLQELEVLARGLRYVIGSVERTRRTDLNPNRFTPMDITLMLATLTATVVIPAVYVLMLILSLANRAGVARRAAAESNTERRRIQSHQ